MKKSNSATLLIGDPISFGDCLAMGDHQLLAVTSDGKVGEAVSMAADLSEGMRNLLRHMHASTNSGELVFCSELKSLAFISDAVLALTRSAQLAMSRAEKEAGQ
ncbi:hypothetical protein EC919_1153 [Pseudomonas graminis]|uniref:hypothetical protein n=1 Tax=Pseudomonas graminis TaxID=158627 RepID=UPI00105BC57D|nr:hypothetical protein [Pseudomonas graminis]TDV43756.1 hypothetical protein EC919_1153 [Pseudomonas graminis]